MENNTLEIQLLSEFCHPLCTLRFIGCRRRKEIPSVSGILTRFPCSANKNACPRGFRRLDGKSCLPRLLGSRICHKSHAIQLSARSVFRLRPALFLYFSTQKDLSCPAISQTKEVSYSLYIQFRRTQKLRNYTARWLVGWLQEPCQLFTFLHLFTITTCISFPKIYIPILPQSGIIVKRNFLRGFGRIFGCVSPFSLVIPLSLPCIFS